MPADVVLADLGADPVHGLTAADVAERRTAYGPNELRSAPPVPWWRKVAAQFRDPLVYLLVVAIGVSLAAWVVEGRDGLPVDAIVIAAILVLNAVIGLVEEAKAADAVAALARMTAATASVLRDGRLQQTPSAELVPGDILDLSEGDAVGADARLLTATGLKIQEASLTGESVATTKTPEPVAADSALGDRASMVHKGTAVVEGVGRAVVTATGMRTEMGSIARLLDEAEREPTPLEAELARVSRTLGLLVIVIAFLVMGVMWVMTRPQDSDGIVTILLTGVSLAVAAVPEGLVAILSLVLAVGVRAMARRNAVMKDLHSVETLGCASVICSDKTGTLTRNEMTLRRIWTASGQIRLTGTGYAPRGSAEVLTCADDPDGAERTHVEARAVLIGGAVANNAELHHDAQAAEDDWEIHGDPTEAAFLVAQDKLEGVRERIEPYTRVEEVPFTSERKMMSVVTEHQVRHDTRVWTKGAPDVLLRRCSAQRVGEDVVALTDADRAEVTDRIEALSAEGYRTLAVAYRTIDGSGPDPEADLEADLILVGVVGLIDPPREEARAAVADARRAGIRPVMITGDHPMTAKAIAADLGITTADGAVLTGPELDALDDAEFAAAVAGTNVFARVAPQHKLRIVDALQEQGRVVAMTGDGVNDAPALKSADIGVAMGITGTEVTKEAATMILGDDNFATIVAAVRQGRVIYDNIAKFLRYLLSSNLGEVTTVLLGVLFASLLGLTHPSGVPFVPLLATQILWINLLTDSGPALAMGVDPELDDVMGRPPRARTDQILDLMTWLRIGWVGLVMGVVTLLAMDLYLPGGLIDGTGDVATARTAGFTTLVLAQLVNAFCARSRLRSAFSGLFVNGWLWAATALGLALQVAVVHLPLLQPAFGTAPLTLTQWAVCLALASVVLWTQEVVKFVERVLEARRPARNRVDTHPSTVTP
ncbi:MAG TPA: cation-translocating P-type ATPase [Intrasporangiaceae bacterium]|nr:cation-translocating P-type ATPase [Intrasporangiaceae bacterium]